MPSRGTPICVGFPLALLQHLLYKEERKMREVLGNNNKRTKSQEYNDVRQQGAVAACFLVSGVWPIPHRWEAEDVSAFLSHWCLCAFPAIKVNYGSFPCTNGSLADVVEHTNNCTSNTLLQTHTHSTIHSYSLMGSSGALLAYSLQRSLISPHRWPSVDSCGMSRGGREEEET